MGLKRIIWNWIGVYTIEDVTEIVGKVRGGLAVEIRELREDNTSRHNIRVSLTATENSLRLIEARLAMIERLKVGDGELGELGARVKVAEDDANRDRLDASAAKLRGMTIEAYRASVEERRKAKERQDVKDFIAHNGGG